MAYGEYLQIAVDNIIKRKLRTGLTILGIVIAITTIVALISIGNGLEKGIQQQFGKIGTNRLYVAAKGSSLQSFQEGLTKEDVKLLETINGIEWINPYLQEQATIKYGKEKAYVTIWATKTDNLEKRWRDIDFEVAEGRLFVEQEKYSAILGYKTATELFNRKIKIGENILINDQQFKVVGIFAEIGNPEDDNVLEIPLETAQELFEREEEVTMIEVVVQEGVNIQEIAKKVKEALEKKRGKDLFDIITPDQLVQQFGKITTIVNVILGAIAGISLVVGGIGIMNTMYTTVLERRKDIGIMKALGAKNNVIFFLFLAEAAIIGVVSGTIGVMLGFSIAKVAEFGAEAAGFQLLQIPLEVELYGGSILFATLLGMFAGFFPAREATKKQVVEVLQTR